MSSTTTDIIIPIWNRPIETRECLGALVEHTEEARLIFIDLGCDFETEQILTEFADHLDDRAILLCTGRTVGFVEAVNLGLEKSTASLRVIIRANSLVSSGWLGPLKDAAQRPDAGILVPRLNLRRGTRSNGKFPNRSSLETIPDSFAALGITGRLYEKIGEFDTGLDSGVWCLKDYSQRANRAGFRTLYVDGSPVLYRDEILYGSTTKRERRLNNAISIYGTRWGEAKTYCLALSKDADEPAIGRVFGEILGRARQGSRFFILAAHCAYRKILDTGRHLLHGNIKVEKLPRFFTSRAVRSAHDHLRGKYPDIVILSDIEELPVQEGAESIHDSERERTPLSAEG